MQEIYLDETLRTQRAPLSVTWWCGQERESTLTPCHLLQAAKAGLRVTGVGQLTLPLSSCSTLECWHCISPRHHNRAVPVWGAGRRWSSLRTCICLGDLEILASPLICHMVGWARERRSPPSASEWRVNPLVMRVGEMPLSLIGCSTWDSRPCSSPRQHNRADPVDLSVNEPVLKAWEQESCPHLLHMPPTAIGGSGPALHLSKNNGAGIGGVSAGEPDPVEWGQEKWPHSLLPAALSELVKVVLGGDEEGLSRQVDQTRSYPGPEAGPPQDPFHLRTVETHERVAPSDPKLQDFPDRTTAYPRGVPARDHFQ